MANTNELIGRIAALEDRVSGLVETLRKRGALTDADLVDLRLQANRKLTAMYPVNKPPKAMR